MKVSQNQGTDIIMNNLMFSMSCDHGKDGGNGEHSCPVCKNANGFKHSGNQCSSTLTRHKTTRHMSAI